MGFPAIELLALVEHQHVDSLVVTEDMRVRSRMWTKIQVERKRIALDDSSSVS